MDNDNYATWSDDAEVLAQIGRSLFGQRTRVTVRLPRNLAAQALARWQRESDEHPRPPETEGQRAVQHKAATLGLIGLSIESDSSADGDEVVVDLDAWHIGDAYRAADEAGLLADVQPPA